MKTISRFSIAGVAALLLTACGGTEDGVSGTSATEAANDTDITNELNSLVDVVPESAGQNCSSGGQKVASGLDDNRDGVLQTSEVGITRYVCNGTGGIDSTDGADGNNGIISLLDIVAEPAGTACTNGGKRIASGLDANRNGILDSSEVTESNYTCNGSRGTDGAAAGNGLRSLVNMVSEPAGTACPNGGEKVTTGLDTNGDGMLQTQEITATSYACNGSPATGYTWVDVTATAVQAQSNIGYVADNINQVSIKLPANPAVGDLVLISGVGAGGWKISQNAGQSIETSNLEGGAIGNVWIPQSTSTGAAVASSADGTRLVSVGATTYISIDSGATWTAGGATPIPVERVAASLDAMRLVAGGYSFNTLFTSTDSGMSWTARGPNLPWNSFASSSDGTHLFAVALGTQIFISADSGVTWTGHNVSASSLLAAVAASADGTRLVLVDRSGAIFSSSNTGQSWIQGHFSSNLNSAASSADGTRLIIASQTGQLGISSNSGQTWTARDSVRSWSSVASSADGTRLAAVVEGGQIYISTDSGVTWTPRDSSRVWLSIASSADGTRFVAVADGRVYTSSPMPMSNTSIGTGGFISGRRGDSIDLQYAGDGAFLVRHSSGAFNVQ